MTRVCVSVYIICCRADRRTDKIAVVLWTFQLIRQKLYVLLSSGVCVCVCVRACVCVCVLYLSGSEEADGVEVSHGLSFSG